MTSYSATVHANHRKRMPKQRGSEHKGEGGSSRRVNRVQAAAWCSVVAPTLYRTLDNLCSRDTDFPAFKHPLTFYSTHASAAWACLLRCTAFRRPYRTYSTRQLEFLLKTQRHVIVAIFCYRLQSNPNSKHLLSKIAISTVKP